MPLYEYECESCGDEEEVLQKWGAPAPVCEQCKYEMVKKVSRSSFALVGGDWASDSYGLKEG